MGLALGLLVLWELGALPVPFKADAGPIGRAAIAIGIAVVGAVLGFVLQMLVARMLPSRRTAARDGETGKH
jgi:hypothetical protein